MAHITINGKDIPLVFDMEAFGQVEEEVGSLVELNEILNGKTRIKNLVKMVRIMGNIGLADSGAKADLTDAKLNKAMKPSELAQYQIAIMNAITDGMKMETEEEEDPKKEKDLVLEEIQKKSEAES